MDLIERINQHFAESAKVKTEAVKVLAEPLGRAAERMVQCLMNEGKILACGNGGSAADAQHFAAELLNRFEMERPGLAAIALTTDSSTLTSIANDYDYAQVFRRPLESFSKEGDVLIALSTSGDSRNVLEAVRAAKDKHLFTIGLSGRRGGALAQEAALVLRVPSDETDRIQEAHQVILHVWSDLIEESLFREN